MKLGVLILSNWTYGSIAQRFNGKYCCLHPLVEIFPEGTKFDLISKAAECGQLYEFYDHVLYGRDQDSFTFDE